MSILVDRSRVLEYHRCPRARWLQYHSGNGLGVRPKRLDMDLHIGTCVHEGTNRLFIGKSEDEAVGQALDAFRKGVADYGVATDAEDNPTYTAEEGAALTEALVRVYSRYALPRLKERFEIVEAEREDLTLLQQFNSYNPIMWMSRCDALLLEKDSGDLYAHSLKTAKEWGEKDDASARKDMQGLSEIWAIDSRLQNWSVTTGGDNLAKLPEWFLRRSADSGAPLVMGVKMEYLLKGRKDKSAGYWAYGSHLIRPWKDTRDDLGSASYAWKYEFTDNFGNKHRLGPKFRRINIWEGMGVKEWINRLEAGVVQPGSGNPLEASCVLPVEYFRNESDTERWLRQTRFQEERIARATQHIREAEVAGDREEVERLLDEYFPQHTRNCEWPKKCPFSDSNAGPGVCFGPREYLFDPLRSPEYVERRPHHEPELVQIENIRN